jgi:hypothetical protein
LLSVGVTPEKGVAHLGKIHHSLYIFPYYFFKNGTIYGILLMFPNIFVYFFVKIWNR